MGKYKPTKGVTSNISSNANPAASSKTQNSNQSSILKSSFSPSTLQLSLFASVIQGLDSQYLRIHDTNTGRLRCNHRIPQRASITCLDWGYHGGSGGDEYHRESKKKRKRTQMVNGVDRSNAGDCVVAFGTTDSEVYLYAPFEAKAVKILSGAHTHGIRDFKFKEYGLHTEGWSIGGDAKLVQWDLRKARAIRTLPLPHGPATTLRPLSSTVICALKNAYILDPNAREQPPVFTASTNDIRYILDSAAARSQAMRFLTAAETDRYLNVFSTDSPTLIGSLRTESEVSSIDLFSDSHQVNGIEGPKEASKPSQRRQEVLLVLSKDGAIEIFSQPFDFDTTSLKEESQGVKARMQKRSRPREAVIRIHRPDKGSSAIPLINASFQGNDITMAWAEGGVNVLFKKIQWRDSTNGRISLEAVTDITQSKSGHAIDAKVINDIKDMSKSHVDESRADIVNGNSTHQASMIDKEPEVIEISSGEDSESDEEVPAEPTENGNQDSEQHALVQDQDVHMGGTETLEAIEQASDIKQEDPDVREEPSFGELIRANAPDAVDVQASFVDPNAQALVPSGDPSLQQLPSGMSLGTVLTQSLRTNDTTLLESCLHVKELSAVRATIERLDSSFASILLQRLAERLHGRPGRAGSLMVWIQWTLVSHGGYLAGQPEIVTKLASLHRVVKDRASSLQPLLSLKGKLDMLEAQMNLRKSMQARSRATNVIDEDDDEGVIYVEGQEGSSSEDEQPDGSVSPNAQLLKGGKQSQHHATDSESGTSDTDSDEEEDSEEEKMPTVNGVVADTEDEDSGSEGEGLFDDEASSTDNDSLDDVSEAEIDHDSVDSADSSDADTTPPPKRPAQTKLSNGISRGKHRV